MNTKSLFAMLGILALGFALGFLTAGHFTKKRMKRIKTANIAKGFQEHFYRIMDLDEAQKEKIAPTVQAYADKLHQTHRDFKVSRASIMDSLQQNIQEELTASQKESLQQFIDRFKKKGPRLKKKRKKRKKMNKKE